MGDNAGEEHAKLKTRAVREETDGGILLLYEAEVERIHRAVPANTRLCLTRKKGHTVASDLQLRRFLGPCARLSLTNLLSSIKEGGCALPSSEGCLAISTLCSTQSANRFKVEAALSKTQD